MKFLHGMASSPCLPSFFLPDRPRPSLGQAPEGGTPADLLNGATEIASREERRLRGLFASECCCCCGALLHLPKHINSSTVLSLTFSHGFVSCIMSSTTKDGMYACIYTHICYALLRALEFGGSSVYGGSNNSIASNDQPRSFAQNLFSVAAMPLAHSLARPPAMPAIITLVPLMIAMQPASCWVIRFICHAADPPRSYTATICGSDRRCCRCHSDAEIAMRPKYRVG